MTQFLRANSLKHNEKSPQEGDEGGDGKVHEEGGHFEAGAQEPKALELKQMEQEIAQQNSDFEEGSDEEYEEESEEESKEGSEEESEED